MIDAQQHVEVEKLRAALRAAETLIYSLLCCEDDEAVQAKKLLDWSNATAKLTDND